MPIQTLPGLELFDWAIIAAFFAVTLGIGLYFSRRAKASLADYFVAGRKMTWWVAGTSIVATSFAADTPLVISGWSRTLGLERNWFWWGGIMGMMLCTFFFARLWRRAKLLTDVEFVELRYSGVPAAGLRMFHASFRSIIQNTLVMGWVTVAMVKILDVTLDIPTIVFVKGQWLPELVAKGIEVSSQIDPSQIAHWPGMGAAIISAKATGIIACFVVATGYSAVSGLWGVMATDVFQFCLAMTGTVILMFMVFLVAKGPTNLVEQAKLAVQEGRVHNRAVDDRFLISRDKLLEAVEDDQALTDRVIDSGLLSPAVSELTLSLDSEPTYAWSADELDQEQIAQRLIDDVWLTQRSDIREASEFKALIGLWRHAYTVSRGAFSDSRDLAEMIGAGLLQDDGSAVDYLRFSTLSSTEDDLRARLSSVGIKDMGEFFAAWRHDKVTPARKITDFFPPFDLKGGGLLAIWSLIVFLGLQWWAGGEGGGFLAQRLFSCKDEKHSVFAMLWYNFVMFVLRPWPWIVVGIGSLFLVPDVSAYGANYDQEHAYIIMLMKYLPVGLKGLMVAALMAAYMSTISTHVNFGASYIVNDIYKRFISKNGSERSYILVSKLATVFLAILAGLYAFYSDSIASGWYDFFLVMSGAGFVVLLRWYWWRISAWSEMAGMGSSLLIFILLKYKMLHALAVTVGLSEYVYLLNEFPVQFTLNLVISTVIWVTVTFLTPPEKDEHLIKFYKRVQPPGGWKRIADAAGHPNHLTIGWVEWTSWFLGCTGLFSMIFSLGHACFGNYGYSAVFGAYGIIATVLIFKLLGKMDWSSITEDEPAAKPE